MYSQATRARALALRAQGHTHLHIASALGVSYGSVRVWLRATGFGRHALTPALLRRASAALQAGKSPDDVAAMEGIATTTIQKAIRDGLLPHRALTVNRCSACGSEYHSEASRSHGGCSDECRRWLHLLGKRRVDWRAKYGDLTPTLLALLFERWQLKRDLRGRLTAA